MQKIQFSLDRKHSDIEIKGEFIEEKTVLLYFSGIIDTYNSQKVYDQLFNFINNHDINNLIFNFKELTYISSTGIGIIVEILKKTNDKGIKLFLMEVVEGVKDVFTLLGFSSLFNYIEDVGEIKQAKRQTFPKKIKCPKCDKELKAIKSGSFRCPNCKHIFRINTEGEIIENK